MYLYAYIYKYIYIFISRQKLSPGLVIMMLPRCYCKFPYVFTSRQDSITAIVSMSSALSMCMVSKQHGRPQCCSPYYIPILDLKLSIRKRRSQLERDYNTIIYFRTLCHDCSSMLETPSAPGLNEIWTYYMVQHSFWKATNKYGRFTIEARGLFARIWLSRGKLTAGPDLFFSLDIKQLYS